MRLSGHVRRFSRKNKKFSYCKPDVASQNSNSMTDPTPTSANGVSYLNITATEKGISEFSHGRRLIFVPQDKIQRVELRFGCHAENPLLQLLFGAFLAGIGIVGAFCLAKAGVLVMRWGIGFVIFGGVGLFCIYEAVKKGYYLQIVSTDDTRKLQINGAVQKTELLKFMTASAELGYHFQNLLVD
jgi:hypothetical protein